MNDRYTIHKEIIVNVSQEKAFRVFTARFDSWWPRTHHIAKVEMKQAVLEPRTGGRWYEIGVDGSECEWGTVLEWDPPHKVTVSWQLTHDYKYDPNFITEVEVKFEPLGANATRVTLEHKHLDRYNEHLEEVRKSIGNEDAGWGRLLKLFAEVAEINSTP